MLDEFHVSLYVYTNGKRMVMHIAQASVSLNNITHTMIQMCWQLSENGSTLPMTECIRYEMLAAVLELCQSNWKKRKTSKLFKVKRKHNNHLFFSGKYSRGEKKWYENPIDMRKSAYLSIERNIICIKIHKYAIRDWENKRQRVVTLWQFTVHT